MHSLRHAGAADEFMRVDGVPLVYTCVQISPARQGVRAVYEIHAVHLHGGVQVQVETLRKAGNRIDWPKVLRVQLAPAQRRPVEALFDGRAE